MNFFRPHCSPIAWILYAVVLFNGLACSVGHGQMLSAFSSKEEAPANHADHSMAGMHSGHQMHMTMDATPKKTDLPGSASPQSGDCSFAGTLTLATILFVALSWLIRLPSLLFRRPNLRLGRPLRHVIPGLNPHAP
jgi:hypothetical protein